MATQNHTAGLQSITYYEASFSVSRPYDRVSKEATSALHTPGPWHYGLGAGKCPAGVGSRNRAPLCKMDGNDIEAQANARLIAAAPDMLEALKWLQRKVCIGLDAHAVISAAIAKAS